jgi:hypothetical protein
MLSKPRDLGAFRIAVLAGFDELLGRVLGDIALEQLTDTKNQNSYHPKSTPKSKRLMNLLITHFFDDPHINVLPRERQLGLQLIAVQFPSAGFGSS